MPNKEPQYIQGQDDKYVSEYSSYIKSMNPDFTDEDAKEYATIRLYEMPNRKPKSESTTTKIGSPDNSLSELAKKYKKPSGTTEAFKDYVGTKTVSEPTLKDPTKEAAKLPNNDALANLLSTAKDLPQEQVKNVTRGTLGVQDNTSVPSNETYQNKVAQTVQQDAKVANEILTGIEERNKDIFGKAADVYLPKGTKEQKNAYAQTLRDNEQAKVSYQAQKSALELPDTEFLKNIRLDDIKKENRGALVASKYGGDAENINSHIREYMESPQWKVDALKYAKNAKDLDRASRVALDVYADKLAGTPSKVQEKISEFMNTPTGQAIAPVAQFAGSLAKAPIETGGFLGALVSKAAGLTDKSLGDKISENQDKADKTIPSFRSESAPAYQQFIGDVAEAFGGIEGGVLGTNKVIPKLFEKGRKAAAYGNLSELSKLASESGKTAQSAYLGEISNALKSSSAIKSAEILDNTMMNIAMMGGAQVASEREKYKSWGFSEEEADKKAMQSALINSVGLALPNVIRPSAVSELKKITGQSGETSALGRIKAASKQGLHFSTDMAALRGVQGAIDGQSLEQTFDGGAKAAAKDFVLGALMNAASGSHGRRAVSGTQREAIGSALKDRSAINSELKNNEQEFTDVNSFLNTIEPYYNSAKQKGLNENLAVADAIEKASMVQAGRKLSEVENEIANSTNTYTALNQQTGQPEQRVRYLHEDGQWRDEPDYNLQERRQNLKNEYELARQASDNIQRGIYDGDRVISSKEMYEIAAKKSPNGKLRPEQEVPVEINSPYNSDVIDLTQYADNPEVQKAIESFGASQLVGDAYVDVTPVIAEDGTILDGIKGIAAALHRGQTEMYAYKSLPKSEVNDIANDAANDALPNEVSEKGLDKIGKQALKEMTEVYADVLNNTFTEDGLPDFASAMQSVIKDGLERGYNKKEVIDMASRINANIPEPILERYYNDAIKQTNEQPESTNIGQAEGVIESQSTNEEIPQRQFVEANISATPEDIGRISETTVSEDNLNTPESATETTVSEVTLPEPNITENGTVELGRTNGGSENKGKQGEGRTVDTEQGTPESNEGNVEVIESTPANPDNSKGVEEVTPKEEKFKVEATGEEVEKTIISRLDKSKVDEKTFNALEASGLTRKRLNFDAVESAAKEFVDKVGYENAIKAIDDGLVHDGAELSAVYTEIDKKIADKILSLEEGTEKDDLRTLRGELINKFGAKGTSAGQQIAYLARVQADPSTPFDAQKEIQAYKESNGGVISKEKEKEIVMKGEEMDELSKRIREIDQEDAVKIIDQYLKDIKSDIDKKESTVSFKDKAKKAADTFRKLKSKPFKFTDAEGNEITALSNSAPLFNELIELGAKAIEKTGEIADGIKAVRERLKSEGWFKNLSDRDKNAVYTQIESFLTPSEFKPDPSEGLTNQYVRDVVKEGVENFEGFIERVQKDFPKMSKTEITDVISKYGKVINATRTELEKEVQKYKSMSLLTSKIDWAINGERPLKTGLQRDAPDADVRSLMKELREAMKELPVTSEMESESLKTSLDAIKTRLQNQIEDYQKQIDKGEKIEKSKRATSYDREATELKEKRDALKEQFDEIFGKEELSDEQRLERSVKGIEKATEKLRERIRENKLETEKKDDAYKYTERYRKAKSELEKEREFLKQLQGEAGVPYKKWIERTKKQLEKQISEDQRRIDQKDYSKVERKKFDDTSELIDLRAKRLKIREELEKEKEKNRLENRTKWEKRKDALLSLWDIPRATRATGEASFVGVQGLIPTIKYGITHPKTLGEAIKNSAIHAFNRDKSEEWIAKMKAQDFYPLMKESKLALTEPNAKVSAAEEQAFSNWTDTIWGIFDKNQKRNPFKAFERSAVTFLDSMRMNMFLDGMEVLENEGYTPKENEKAYKDLAKYVNTFTGRGTLISGVEGTKAAEALTKVFFSPRLWAAKIQRLNPVYYKNLDPKVRELALKDLTRFIGLSTSLTLLAASQLNNDDDPNTNVELDPRSSDFMKLKYGNTRIDFFGGNLTELVYLSRMMPYVGGYKSTRKPEVKELGQDRFTPNRFDLTLTQATNKLNPAAAMVYRYFNKEKDGKGVWRDAYGKEYSLNQDVMESLTPIYWGNTVPELIQDKDADFTLPALIGLGAFSFFGGGVNTYEQPKSKSKTNNAVRVTPQ